MRKQTYTTRYPNLGANTMFAFTHKRTRWTATQVKTNATPPSQMIYSGESYSKPWIMVLLESSDSYGPVECAVTFRFQRTHGADGIGGPAYGGCVDFDGTLPMRKWGHGFALSASDRVRQAFVKRVARKLSHAVNSCEYEETLAALGVMGITND